MQQLSIHHPPCPSQLQGYPEWESDGLLGCCGYLGISLWMLSSSKFFTISLERTLKGDAEQCETLLFLLSLGEHVGQQ